MVIFATPDFGTSGIIVLFRLIAWVFVLAICVGGIILGARLLRRGSLTLGWLLLLVSCFLPIFCYVAPPHLFRWAYGSYPLEDRDHCRYGEIKVGMPSDEVQAILGPPHHRWKYGDGRETWNYKWEWYGAGFFDVEFGPDGRVDRTCGN
jgi:hypothetical protein